MRVLQNHTFKLCIALFFSLCFPSFLSAKEAQKTLPKVLIIGDSISIGYTPAVKNILKGKATVIHHKGNAGHTGNGLKKIDQWLGDTQWDVIHFNFGLHDLCYRHPDSKVYGKRDKVKGKQTNSLDVYEKNLDTIVTRLKKTNAQLIWGHTTHVPEKEAGRFVGDDVKYNQRAEKIMIKHNIVINDLYKLTKSFNNKYFTKPGDVHYTKEGSKKIGQQVADYISKKLVIK